jgi:hypothetical protein
VPGPTPLAHKRRPQKRMTTGNSPVSPGPLPALSHSAPVSPLPGNYEQFILHVCLTLLLHCFTCMYKLSYCRCSADQAHSTCSNEACESITRPTQLYLYIVAASNCLTRQRSVFVVLVLTAMHLLQLHTICRPEAVAGMGTCSNGCNGSNRRSK